MQQLDYLFWQEIQNEVTLGSPLREILEYHKLSEVRLSTGKAAAKSLPI